MLRLKPTFLIVFAFWSLAAWAKSGSENFRSSQRKLSSDMVWNLRRGELHPPVLVAGWDRGVGAESAAFDVGDGRHGTFIRSRYASFSASGITTGNIIRIDTDARPELQLTYFHLEAGWTIRPVGSRPLVFRVQGEVLIEGDIDCSGADGESAATNGNAILLGGRGFCGGGDGGASVAAGVAPNGDNAGASGGTFVTSGVGGPIFDVNGGMGGGGGGAYIKAYAVAADKNNPENGEDGVGASVGGAVGTIYRDDAFVDDIDGAGSGGGGGSGYSGLPAETSSGGSGGGGGGNIRIYAVDNIEVSGNILASGGNGGVVSDAARLGGGGGGGGGGSILIFSAGNINITGSIIAAAGTGGNSTGGRGGNGAWGRTWLTDADFAPTGLLEDPITQLNNPGAVVFETDVVYEVLSKAFDMGNTKPTLTSLSPQIVDQLTSTVSFEMAFSATEAMSDFPAFVDHLTYINQEVSRFARFRLLVENKNATTPIRVTGLNWQYAGFQQTDFNFTTGCGDAKSNNVRQASMPVSSLILVLLLMGLPLFYIYHSRPK